MKFYKTSAKRKKIENTTCPTKTKYEGILAVNKIRGVSSFYYIRKLRQMLGIKKIGHTGTLDPLASGLLLLLIGKKYTKQAQHFLECDKQYKAVICLGKATTTYDEEGETVATNNRIVSASEVQQAVEQLQGTVAQIPPMFSAKKFQGKKLYELARKNIIVDRKPCMVEIKMDLLSYNYPDVHLDISCSKGTYIRSIANDMGNYLQTGAYLKELTRTRIGSFSLENAVQLEDCFTKPEELLPYLVHGNVAL